MIEVYNAVFIFSAFLFSFAGTGGAYAVLKRFQVLDNPNIRSNHTTPTPRGGGLGFVFAIAAMLLVLQAPAPLLFAFIALSAVSFIDDLRYLHAGYRFAAQIAAICLLLATQHMLPGLLPATIELPLVALAWLWFINLFNFMDGSDGLAASEAVAIAAGIICLLLPGEYASFLSQYAWIIAAAVLGFLPWNWHKAKIFMGDAGSIPLGFLIGYLLIHLASMGYLAAALILPAVFLIDATSTLIMRLMRGERIWQAHSSHAYQTAIRAGLSHDAVARETIAMNLLLIIFAVTSAFNETAAWISLALAYASTIWLLFFRFRRYGKTDITA